MNYEKPEIHSVEIVAEQCFASSIITADDQIFFEVGTNDNEFTKETNY